MEAVMNDRSLPDKLVSLPRQKIVTTPTPLEPAERLSSRLGIRLLLKRDDLGGLGCGGNKLRKLEFILGKALGQGVDTLLTTGGPQSNHARLTAALAARMGFRCELYLKGEPRADVTGNLLLDRLFDADVAFLGEQPYDQIHMALDRRADELRAAGRRPCVIPLGGATPEGTLGYVLAFHEMLEQCAALGIKPDWVVVAGGTGSTAAGLAVGAGLWSPGTRIASISVSWSRETLEAEIRRHVESAASVIGVDAPAEGTFCVFDEYIGPGYSRPSDSGGAALRLMARQEGVLLDMTYTAKAVAGLIDLARQGVIAADSSVVFVHTGGTPELFARDPSVLLA